MKGPTDHSLMRKIILDIFCWMGWISQDERKDLSIRSASGKIHLASGKGRTDPAVHRVGDLGDGGTFTVPFPGTLRWTGPDGSQWSMTFTSAAAGAPVAIAIVHIDGEDGKIVTKAVTGSERVTSG